MIGYHFLYCYTFTVMQANKANLYKYKLSNSYYITEEYWVVVINILKNYLTDFDKKKLKTFLLKQNLNYKQIDKLKQTVFYDSIDRYYIISDFPIFEIVYDSYANSQIFTNWYQILNTYLLFGISEVLGI